MSTLIEGGGVSGGSSRGDALGKVYRGCSVWDDSIKIGH